MTNTYRRNNNQPYKKKIRDTYCSCSCLFCRQWRLLKRNKRKALRRFEKVYVQKYKENPKGCQEKNYGDS